ncbi:MAG: metalloprotease PmbA [Gammaproteobacteria bacterium]
MKDQEEIERLKNIVRELLDEAKQQGATGAEAGLSAESGLSVTARLGDVETIEYHRDQGLGVTVYFGKRKGSASTTDLMPESIRETVNAACSIARFAGEDDFAGLPDAFMLAKDIPELDLCHPWEVTADEAIALAIECEDAARAYHPEISNSEGASVDTHHSVRILGNTLGFLHGYPTTRHSLSCSVVGRRGNDMQRDYWYTLARSAGELESAAEVGKKAAERTIRRLGARSLSTRHCPVLYSAEIASGLIGHFIRAVSGGSLYRKSSFLLDSLDKQVFPEFMRIHEQPHLINALGSAPYDGEGVATKARDIVSAGTLRSYVLSSYSARKLGMQTTGNAGGVHNLIVESGEDDFSAMLKKLDTGLLATELMGQGVNPVTGDYSRGAAGFWVENGEIQFPVEEITIAGNLREMYRDILAVGNDVDCRGNIRTGSILVGKMTVAGN